MPGETTQRIALCAPYAAAGAHEAHPVTTTEGKAWCPGNPPRNPDGSELDVRELEPVVPLAGELRALTDETRDAALQAEEYAVTVDGITCRVSRRARSSDVLRRPQPGDPPAWWEAHIGQASAHETMIQKSGRPETVMVATTARFGFNPEDLDSEQIALDRAGHYCQAIAGALARLWREQQRVHAELEDAVQRARVVAGALPES